MKKIRPVFIGLFGFLIIGCQNNNPTVSKQEKKENSYAIIGKVTGQDTGMIYIVHKQKGLVDTAILDHGFFTFKGQSDNAELCELFFSNASKKFFLENGKITMLVKKDSMQYALISGTKVQDEYNYFNNQLLKPLVDRVDEAWKAYYIAQFKKNRQAIDSLNMIFKKLGQEQKNLIIDYTKSHPSSIVAAYEIFRIGDFGRNLTLSLLDSLYMQLDTTVRTSFFGVKIQGLIKKQN